LPVGVHTSILQYINFVLFEIRVSEQVIFELLRYMRMHCHKWFNIRKKNSWTLLLVISQKNDIHDIWCILRPYPPTHMKYRASCCRNMTSNLRQKCF
jgi:hypothetical protein